MSIGDPFLATFNLPNSKKSTFKTYPNLQTPRNLAALACAFETDTSCCWSSKTSWWTHIKRGLRADKRKYIHPVFLLRNYVAKKKTAFSEIKVDFFRARNNFEPHWDPVFFWVTKVWGRYSQKGSLAYLKNKATWKKIRKFISPGFTKAPQPFDCLNPWSPDVSRKRFWGVK